jgi:PAS domain S-box-containing protein
LWEREILDHLVQGLVGVPAFLTDAQGLITSLTPSLEGILGYPASAVIGRSAREFWMGSDDDGMKILKELAIRDRVVDVEVSIRAKTGEEVPCRVTAAVVKDSRGRVAGIVGSLGESPAAIQCGRGGYAKKDDTRRAAHDGVPTALEAAALIAHEVKNPLASMYLNVEMLGDHIECIPNEAIRVESRELVDSMIGEIERLRDITREHLERASASHVRFRAQSLGKTLLELQRFMHKEMELRQVEFANTFCPREPDLLFDRERLKEAVMNLYKNSADAMPEGGEIITVTRVVDGWAEILISDTGPGISAADAESLFRPFFTTKEGGTGLGLTIVEEILEEHGGGIEVRREPGEGMLLVLRLPLQS